MVCCLMLQPVGLGKIAKLINAGQIDSHELITMKTLKVWSQHSSLFDSVTHVSVSYQTINADMQDVGAIGKQIEDGVRLMGRGADEIKWPLHFEVTI